MRQFKLCTINRIRSIVVFDDSRNIPKILDFIREQLTGSGLVRTRSGTLITGNLVKFYNVASVSRDIYVGSMQELTPGQTRRVGRMFLKAVEGGRYR